MATPAAPAGSTASEAPDRASIVLLAEYQAEDSVPAT